MINIEFDPFQYDRVNVKFKVTCDDPFEIWALMTDEEQDNMKWNRYEGTQEEYLRKCLERHVIQIIDFRLNEVTQIPDKK